MSRPAVRPGDAGDGETIARLLAEGRARLATASFAPSSREAILLLARVLDLSEAQILARPGIVVARAQAACFRTLLDRRLTGEPVAYLLREKEFYGRSFIVDRRVLIPRPETEHLVEAVLALPPPPAPRILDLGTGSGCLAVTLAAEIRGARVCGIDLSPAALAVAAANARRHGCAGQVALAAADLAAAIDLVAFDLVVSNPPYIGEDERAGLSPEVKEFEPALALYAGARGEAVLERLLAELALLRPGTPVVLEIGRGQLERVRELAAGSPLALVAERADYAGIPRVVLLSRRR